MTDDRQRFIDFTFIKLMRLFCEFDVAIQTGDDILKDRLISEFMVLKSVWEASEVAMESER